MADLPQPVDVKPTALRKYAGTSGIWRFLKNNNLIVPLGSDPQAEIWLNR
jgi:hypothetical protein